MPESPENFRPGTDTDLMALYQAAIGKAPRTRPGNRRRITPAQAPDWLTEWRAERDARYRILSCGHYTDKESQERYLAWRPRRGVWFCEECEEWLPFKRTPKVKPPEVPEF